MPDYTRFLGPNAMGRWSPFSLGLHAGANFDMTKVSRLFQADGVTPVDTPGQPIYTTLDETRGSSLGAELKGNGIVGITGVATPATYNTVTGEGETSRAADVSNHSWIRLATGLTPGEQYLLDIQTGTTSVTIREASGGVIYLTPVANTRSRLILTVSVLGEVYIATGANNSTSIFTVHSFAKLALPVINQPTVGLRPLWGRAPVSVRNQLAQTENLANAIWGGYWVKPALEILDPSISELSATTRLTYDPALGGGGGTNRQMGLLFSAPSPWVAGDYDISFLMRWNTRIPSSVAIGHGTSATLSLYVDDVLVSGPSVSSVVAIQSFLTLGQVHEIRLRVNRSTAAVSTRIFELRLDDSLAGQPICTFDLAELQVETGTVKTNYQRVGVPTDITEAGVQSFGFVRHDKADDTYPIYCPAAITGYVVILSRQGSWIEPISVAANGLLTLGPTGTPGQPGLLTSLTDIVDILVYDRMPTEEEKARLLRKYRDKGVLGWLVEGPNLIINGGFDTDASTWGLGTDWAWNAGKAEKTAGTATALAQAETLTAPQPYLVTFDLVRTAGTLLARFTGSTTVSGAAQSASGAIRQILVAAPGNTTLELFGDAAFAGSVDNVTLQLLTPEAAP